jgi:acetoin utilization deacetylase AcuC-like enzyme
VDRTKSEVAGTLLTARLALQHGLACNTAGGTHHAFADYGSGFCILNDLAYTAHVLLREGAASRILILDLDVHQVRGCRMHLKEYKVSRVIYGFTLVSCTHCSYS